jgi:hypothetical protein
LFVEQSKKVYLSELQGQIDLGNKALIQTNSDLVEFLAKNNLSYLTYSQLEELTGYKILSNETIVLQSQTNLPTLPPDELKKLSNLIGNQLRAETLYNQVFGANQVKINAMQNSLDSIVVKQAVAPKTNLSSIFIYFILGALVALILGIVVILVAEWWKTPSPENTQIKVQS